MISPTRPLPLLLSHQKLHQLLLQHVVRALLAPLVVALAETVVANGGEEGDEDDISLTRVVDSESGSAGEVVGEVGAQDVEGEPVFDAVLQIEAPGVLGNVAAEVGPGARAFPSQ